MRQAQGSAEKIVGFIRSATRRYQRPPTIREIQAALGFKSPRAVTYFLEKLEKARRVVRRGRSRGIFLVGEERGEEMAGVGLPFFSAIPAGRGDVADGVPDKHLQIEPSLFGLRKAGNAFVVKVRGRSMEGAGIRDGDLAVLEKREAKAGEVVAALFDGEVTLKRLMGTGRNLFLQSENPDYPDLRPRQEMEIQGVLVGLVRRWEG
jgi:repressor LexA